MTVDSGECSVVSGTAEAKTKKDQSSRSSGSSNTEGTERVVLDNAKSGDENPLTPSPLPRRGEGEAKLRLRPRPLGEEGGSPSAFSSDGARRVRGFVPHSVARRSGQHSRKHTAGGLTLYAECIVLCLVACISISCRHRTRLTPYIAFVVNNQSATLAAVNLADFHVTASLPVSPQPERVLSRPHAHQLYVVSATGEISVAAFPHLHLVSTVDVGASAKDPAFSPDGRTAYVLNPAGHELVFLNCAAGGTPDEAAVPKVGPRLQLRGTPADMALSQDGKTLVVSSQSPDLLTFISTETRQVLGTVEVGKAPGPLVILPDSSKVFVADTGEEKVSAADLTTRTLLSHIELGARPTALLLKPDGGELFVLAGAAGKLVILDAFHDNVERTFPLGLNPVAGVFRPDMSVLYIAHAGDGSVLSLDVANREVMASTHVGIAPRALALTPDGRLLVVADRAASSLAIMRADPASLSQDRSVLLTTVPTGAAPVDVIVPNQLGDE